MAGITFSRELATAMNDVWQAIGADILENGEMSNRDAVEACMDAGRLGDFGYPDALFEARALFQAHGFTATVDAAASAFKLN